MTNEPYIACPGCGASVPDTDGPTHDYIGAPPGCWALFGEVLAREYSDVRYWPVHHLTVDAYAAQHPGTPSRQAMQSVAVHLISLYLQIERGYDVERAQRAIQRAVANKQAYVWLDPPAPLGDVTVRDVHAASSPAEHVQRVKAWAAAVWNAWTPHHATIRRWAEHAQHTRD